MDDPHAFLVALRERGIREYVVHLPLESNYLGILRGKTNPRINPSGHLHFYDTHSAIGLLVRSGMTVTKWVYTPELDLDIKLHRTIPNMLAYVPRKILFTLLPGLATHTLGGAALMARCQFNPTSD